MRHSASLSEMYQAAYAVSLRITLFNSPLYTSESCPPTPTHKFSYSFGCMPDTTNRIINVYDILALAMLLMYAGSNVSFVLRIKLLLQPPIFMMIVIMMVMIKRLLSTLLLLPLPLLLILLLLMLLLLLLLQLLLLHLLLMQLLSQTASACDAIRYSLWYHTGNMAMTKRPLGGLWIWHIPEEIRIPMKRWMGYGNTLGLR